MAPLRTLVVLLNIDFISGWGPPGQGLLYAKGHLMEEADFVAEEEVAGIKSVAVCAAIARQYASYLHWQILLVIAGIGKVR